MEASRWARAAPLGAPMDSSGSSTATEASEVLGSARGAVRDFERALLQHVGRVYFDRGSRTFTDLSAKREAVAGSGEKRRNDEGIQDGSAKCDPRENVEERTRKLAGLDVNSTAFFSSGSVRNAGSRSESTSSASEIPGWPVNLLAWKDGRFEETRMRKRRPRRTEASPAMRSQVTDGVTYGPSMIGRICSRKEMIQDEANLTSRARMHNAWKNETIVAKDCFVQELEREAISVARGGFNCIDFDEFWECFRREDATAITSFVSIADGSSRGVPMSHSNKRYKIGDGNEKVTPQNKDNEDEDEEDEDDEDDDEMERQEYYDQSLHEEDKVVSSTQENALEGAVRLVVGYDQDWISIPCNVVSEWEFAQLRPLTNFRVESDYTIVKLFCQTDQAAMLTQATEKQVPSQPSPQPNSLSSPKLKPHSSLPEGPVRFEKFYFKQLSALFDVSNLGFIIRRDDAGLEIGLESLLSRNVEEVVESIRSWARNDRGLLLIFIVSPAGSEKYSLLFLDTLSQVSEILAREVQATPTNEDASSGSEMGGTPMPTLSGAQYFFQVVPESLFSKVLQRRDMQQLNTSLYIKSRLLLLQDKPASLAITEKRPEGFCHLCYALDFRSCWAVACCIDQQGFKVETVVTAISPWMSREDVIKSKLLPKLRRTLYCLIPLSHNRLAITVLDNDVDLALETEIWKENELMKGLDQNFIFCILHASCGYAEVPTEVLRGNKKCKIVVSEQESKEKSFLIAGRQVLLGEQHALPILELKATSAGADQIPFTEILRDFRALAALRIFNEYQSIVPFHIHIVARLLHWLVPVHVC